MFLHITSRGRAATNTVPLSRSPTPTVTLFKPRGWVTDPPQLNPYTNQWVFLTMPVLSKEKTLEKLHSSPGRTSSWHQRLVCKHSAILASASLPQNCPTQMQSLLSWGSPPVYLKFHFQKGSTHVPFCVHLDKSLRVFLHWGSGTSDR